MRCCMPQAMASPWPTWSLRRPVRVDPWHRTRANSAVATSGHHRLAVPNPQLLGELADCGRDGSLRVPISATYGLDHVAHAFKDFGSGSLGKISVAVRQRRCKLTTTESAVYFDPFDLDIKDEPLSGVQAASR